MTEQPNLSSAVECGVTMEEEDVEKAKSTNSKKIEEAAEEKLARWKFLPSGRFLLLLVVLCVFSSAIGFALGFFHHQFFWNKDNEDNKISSNNTVTQAAQNNDSNANVLETLGGPCFDFYFFACNDSFSGIRKLDQDSEQYFKDFKQKVLEYGEPENGAEEKAHNFYRSCVKAVANPESMAGSRELEKMLDQVEQIPRGHLRDKLRLVQNEYGLGSVLDWGIDLNFLVSDLDANESDVSLSKPAVVNDREKDEQFTRLLEKSSEMKTVMAKILENRLNFTCQINDFDKLIDLDKGFEKMTGSDVMTTCYYFNKSLENFVYLIEDKPEDVPGFINWKDYFRNKHANLTFVYGVTNMFFCPVHFPELSKKLNRLQNSDGGMELLDKYLIWKIGKKLVGQILIAGKNSSDKSADTQKNSTNDICAILTEKSFPSATASIHRRRLLNEYPDLEIGPMQMVQQVTENIRDELILVLKEAAWLDEESRERAVEKARKTRVILGYPDHVKSSKLLEDYYKFHPQMNESDFIGNSIHVLKVEKQNNPTTLRSLAVEDKNESFVPFSRLEDMVMANNAKALYDCNTIFIPIRNLVPPNFYRESPESLTYGRIGTRIGHEFAHLFSGSKWDEHGNFKSLWTTEETRKKMENQSNCLIRQYSKFSYPNGKSLDGKYTLEENFADNVGFEIAARAFFRLFSKNNSKEFPIPIPMDAKLSQATNQQRFFISFATVWCSDKPLKYSDDSHSPAKFRVLGTLQNSQAFSDAFRCPPKSGMNPEEKCPLF